MTASMPPDGLSLLWCASDDVERSERYKAGGYHPVCLGDILATSAAADARRYRVLHKLGHGSFSTVWLASDLHDPDAAPGYVAVKICVADANAAHQLAAFKAAAGQHVVELLDSFLLRGPNGTHLALVHPVLGSLEDLPHLAVAQPLCRQLAEGVAFLHARGVVHGDLHLGNVGVSLPTLQTHSMRALVNYEGQPDVTVMLSLGHAERPEGLPPYLVQPLALAEFLSLRDPEFMDSAWNVKIMDLGNAVLEGEPPRPACTPAAVCAPEIMFSRVAGASDAPATRASDIWSMACTMYELVFGAHPFYYAGENDAHLAKLVKTCGEIPSSWTAYFASRPKLANLVVSTSTADDEWLRRVDSRSSAAALARAPPGHSRAKVEEFLELVRFMLKMDPVARPTAEDVLRRPWFIESVS